LIKRILTVGRIRQSEFLRFFLFSIAITNIAIFGGRRCGRRFALVFSVSYNPRTNLIAVHDGDRTGRVDETIAAAVIEEFEGCYGTFDRCNGNRLSVSDFYGFAADTHSCRSWIFSLTTRGIFFSLIKRILTVGRIRQSEFLRFSLGFTNIAIVG